MKQVNIDTPDHTIRLKDLNDPKEIYDYFKQHGIKKYVYGIKCSADNDLTGKYGLSGKSGGRMIPAERVRGQCAQMAGWVFNTDDLKVGRDFLSVMEELNATNKDLYTIEIWDYTNEPDDSYDPDLNIERGEAELLKQFEARHNRLPIGNKQIERVPGAVSKETFDSLFD